MNLKRPSFRIGGSTGIGQLTPNRQMYAGGGNIGGGTIAGSNLGTRTGFESIILQSSGLPYPDTAKPKYNNPFKIKGYPSSKGILEALKPKGLARFPITTGVGSTAAIGAIPAYLAYMNRPKTMEEKRVMQEYGPIDETFFQYDEYDADRKRARGVGEEISFKEALFKDPKTGLYPKIFGDTESRTKRAEIEKAKEERDDFEMPRGGGADFAEIAETVIADKKEKKDTPLKPDAEYKEPSFEDTYEAEKKKIEKLIGEDDNKGLLAIALSDAIGTPGTIADKAAVLNKSLLGIMQGKKKDRKDIAKLAYTATKEIEKAKLVAGKEGFSEKQLNKMRRLTKIVNDKTGSFTKEQKAAAQAELSMERELIKAIGGKSTAEKVMKPGDAREQIKRFKDGAKKLAKMDKGDPGYGAALNEYMAEIEFLSNYPELMPSIRRIDAIYANVLAANKKDGGRIGFANGTPMEESIQVSETVGQSQVPTAQTSQLSFEEIRNRLPKEITDDVVRLIAGSNEALQDFSYIRTQGDVDKFNMKYGVTLVLPQSTA